METRGGNWDIIKDLKPYREYYRPVSLTSVCCRILESLIQDHNYKLLTGEWSCLLKAKFHYTIQLANMFAISRHVEIARTWSQTGSQLVCDQLASWRA